MLPEQLRSYVRKPPAGARVLVVVTEGPLGVGPSIAEWQREQVEADDGVDTVTNEVLESCQSFADSEGTAIKFLLQWKGSTERPISSRAHRVAPATPAEAEEPGRSLPLSDVLARELLGHIARQQRQLNEALPTITSVFKDTLATMTELLKDSHKREAEARAATAPAQPVVAQREATPEEREEAIQRARALEAFTGKLPSLMDLAISVAAAKLLPPDPNAPPGVQ